MSQWRRHANTAADVLLAGALCTAPLAWGRMQYSGLAVASTLVSAAWVLLLGAARPPGSLRLPRGPVPLPMVVLVAVALASAAVSVSRFATWVEAGRLAVGAALLVALAREPVSLARAQLALAALALGGAAAGWLGAREYVYETVVANNAVWRAFGGFITPNGLAGYLIMALPAAVALVVLSRSLVGHTVWGVAAALTGAGIFLSGSRGGQLAFLPALALFLLLMGHAYQRRRLAWGLALAAVGGCALAALAVTPLRVRLVGLFAGQDASMIFRYLVWQSSLKMALAHPLLGTGAGSFALVYPRFAIAGFTMMAHQNYLQLAAEMGLAGLGAFLWLAGAGALCLRRAWAGWKPLGARLVLAACAAGGVGLLLHSLLDYGWYLGPIMLAYCGLLGVAANLAPGEPAREPVRQGRRGQEAAPPPSGLSLTRPWSRGLVTAALLVPLLATTWNAASLATADQRLEAADQAEAQGDYYQARADCQQAVAIRPDYPQALRQLARMSGLEEGLRLVRRAAAVEPTNALNYALAGRLLVREGDRQAAIGWYRLALRQSPHYTAAWRELAQVYETQRQYRQADDCYRELLVLEAGPYGHYQALQAPETEFAFAHYWRLRRLMGEGGPEARADARREAEAALAPIVQARQVPTVSQILEAVATGNDRLPPELVELEARTRYRLSQVLAGQGEKEEAARQREQAQQLCPQVADLVAAEPRIAL